LTLFSTPLVVFRAAGGAPAALLDRCPHRNVPLSLGKVRGDRLQCAYHGWEFDGTGACCAVPGLVGEVRSRERGVTSFTAREAQGFVWVYGREGAAPAVEPFVFPHVGERGYTSAIDALEVRGSLHATAENALDVPHTAFLHGGLFRNETRPRREIEVIVRRHSDRVEAEYVGESRPPGVVAKLLAPRGGDVIHTDRFILPSIAQVEYRLGDSSSAQPSPVGLRHKLFVTFTFRLPFPVRSAAILRPLRCACSGDTPCQRANRNHRTLREERYKFTEIDVLGSEIYDLLKRTLRRFIPPQRSAISPGFLTLPTGMPVSFSASSSPASKSRAARYRSDQMVVGVRRRSRTRAVTIECDQSFSGSAILPSPRTPVGSRVGPAGAEPAEMARGFARSGIRLPSPTS
jgi:nitrite reductase/ring-hydroxylating ferredoxin subunit